MPQTRKAYRAAILHSIADPAVVGIDASYEYFEDGLLVTENGRISAIGHASELLPSLAADVEVVHHKDALITPGFIDTHIHLPQTGMVGAYGEQLLDWLNTYTFPAKASSPTRPTPRKSPGSSSRNCCATAPPPRWCSAACTRSRWIRSSKRRKSSTCG